MNQNAGIILPSPDILNEFEHGRFVLSNLAAKRAKQIKEGAPPLVRIDSNHPLTIALAEIAAGKIRAILGPEDAIISVLDNENKANLLHDETVPAELGMLLPALDESEVELVIGDALMAEDDHEEEAADPDGVSLSDLLGADAEVESEAPVVDSEENTMSLTDLADEEEGSDEAESSDI